MVCASELDRTHRNPLDWLRLLCFAPHSSRLPTITFPPSPSHHHLLISASVASRSTLPIFLVFSSRQVLLASFLILFRHDSLTDLLFLQPITPLSACATALVCAALLANTPSQRCASGRVPETRNLLEKLFLNDFSETYRVRSF